MKNRVLVIGSNSFSGSHFALELIRKGFEVLGVSRSERPHKIFCPEMWKYETKYSTNFVKIDLNHDLDKLEDLFESFMPNYIVNFASQGMVAESWTKPLDWFQTNLMAQIRVIEKLKNYKNLIKFVHISTPEVYGNTENSIKENNTFSPSTPYAVSRAAFDLHLLTYFKEYDFPVIFTRAANVYGPGQQLYRIVPRAILACMFENKFPLHGGGISKRSFVYIDDLVEATEKIMVAGKIGEVYHISSDNLMPIKSIVDLVAQKYGKRLHDICFDHFERQGKDDSYSLNSSKIRRDLNWKENISIEKGISNIVKWGKIHEKEILKLPWNYSHKT